MSSKKQSGRSYLYRWEFQEMAGEKTPSLKKKFEKVMVRVEETREIQKDFLSLSEKWGNKLRGQANL